MPWWMSWILVFFVWAVGCGGVFAYLMDRHAKNCAICKKGKACDEGVGWMLFAAIAWPLSPIVLPFVAGALAGMWLAGRPERKKAKVDRKKLEHDRRMAELKAQKEASEAAVALLEAEGWKARVIDPEQETA